MKKILIAALALSAATSYADNSSFDGFYVGGGFSGIRNSWNDTNWVAGEIFGGYKLNSFVGGEMRVGKSSGGSSHFTNFESIYYRTESSNSVGKTYLLLGYTHADLESENGNFNFNGISYGAGVGFTISDHFNLNLEYKVLLDGDATHYLNKFTRDEGIDVKLSSIAATVDYRF